MLENVFPVSFKFFFFPSFPPLSFKSHDRTKSREREIERSNRNSRIVFPVKIGEITWKRSLPVTSLRVCFSRPFSYRFSAGNLPDIPHLSLFIWERIRLFFVLYFFPLSTFLRARWTFFFPLFLFLFFTSIRTFQNPRDSRKMYRYSFQGSSGYKNFDEE